MCANVMVVKMMWLSIDENDDDDDDGKMVFSVYTKTKTKRIEPG